MPEIDRLARTLVNASLELHRRRAWRSVPPESLFLIRVPDEEHALAAALIGPGSGDPGLFLSRGPDALGRFMRLQAGGGIGGERFEQCDHLIAMFVRLGELREDLRKPLTAAGFRTRREGAAPCFGVKPPGRQLRTPNRKEQRTLAWALAAVLAAEDQGDLNPVRLEPGGQVLELEVGGTLTAAEVVARRVPLELDELAALEAPVLLPEELSKEPRLDARWGVAVTPMAGSLEGDDRMYHAVVVLDEDTEMALSTQVVPGCEARYVVEPLIDAFQELGVPRRVVFDRETMMDALGPALAGLEVESALERGHPLLAEAAADLEVFLQTEGLDDQAREALAQPPTTLEDWKHADLNFRYRTFADLEEKEAITPRALKQYFGSEELGMRVLDELEDLAPLPALVEWVAADYRPNKRTKPYFDRRLEEPDLREVERALIESRRGALLSFFKVLRTEPGASLEVEDVIEKRRLTLYDHTLSCCNIEGFLLPLRLFQLGRWFVPSIAGPPISSADGDRLIAECFPSRARHGPGGMRAHAHLLGRIWAGYLKK